MKLILVAGVAALTGLTFFSATQTLPLVDSADVITTLQVEVDAQAAELEAAQSALTEQAETLNNTIADLSAKHQDQASQLEEANLLVTNVDTENLKLIAEINEQTDRIAELSAQTSNAVEAQTALASLEQENAEMVQRITDLAASVEAEKATVAALETRLAQTDSGIVATEQPLAETTPGDTTSAPASATDDLEGQIAALTTQNTELDEALGKRDDVIAGLMASTGSDMGAVTTCQERTDELLAETQISFETGTIFTEESIFLLEQIAMVAVDCVRDDLKLEIEGHTDNSGDFATNLLLSDARAKAVLDFLVEHDVPAQAMRSASIGDREPIADNDTSIGRSQNQRITFDWEQG